MENQELKYLVKLYSMALALSHDIIAELKISETKNDDIWSKYSFLVNSIHQIKEHQERIM